MSATTVYQNGDTVSYDGEQWQVNWYTQNQPPSQTPYGPWQYLGGCPG